MIVDYERRLADVRGRLADAAAGAGRSPAEIRLVAVSKYASVDQIVALFGAGQRDFGENYVADGLGKKHAVETALGKAAADADKPRWHMIGRLQSNKAARAAEAFDLIHTLSSLRAARMIARTVEKGAVPRRVLVQLHLGGGEGRAGVMPDQVRSFVREVCDLDGLLLDGVMGVAPLGQDPRPHFARLREVRDAIRALGEPRAPMTEISAGMSSDYVEAIAEGATIVRIGRSLFAP